MNFQSAARAYIRNVLEETGLTAGGLASAAGVSPSTLTRALNDPKHKYKLSMTTIEKIANFSQISPAPFLKASDSVHMNTAYWQEDLAKNDDEAHSFNWVVCEVAAGKWREPSVSQSLELGPIRLKHTLYEIKDQFAAIVRGDSASSFAKDGDILLVVRQTEKQMRDANHAVPVLVERRSTDGAKVEITARFLRPEPGKQAWRLLSADAADLKNENKPRRIKTVVLENPMGNEDLSIVGVVEYVIPQDLMDATNFVSNDLELSEP